MSRSGYVHGRRAAARRLYDQYMSSPAWWAFRKAWHEWAETFGDVHCLGCGQEWSLRDDLHHLTYERLRRESFTDLWPLCRECHVFVHAVLDRPGWYRAGRVQAHRAALAALRILNNIERAE